MAGDTTKIKRAPFPTDPEEFNDDDRVSYDQVSQSHKLEDEAGEEWEWLPKHAKWVPVTDDALVAQQQSVYKVAGVDENEPAMDLRKRKAGNDEANGNAKKQKAEKPQAPQKTKAIFVQGLPLDADEEEVEHVFKRCGLIAESAGTNTPRIKLYNDEHGKFKGEALIVFHRAESVQIAIQMFDDSDFRLGQTLPSGAMRVSEAEERFKSQKEQPLQSQQAKTKGTGANRDRQQIIKKNEEMNSRLADWDDDDPSAVQQVSSRWDKVVVLKHMFTIAELEKDPAEALDIKEDIRTECEKHGQVTNVVLYDKEPDGVVTVRFSDKVAAEAAVRALHGRKFGGPTVDAYIADGSERFVKSHKGETEGEAERLDDFGKFLEGEGEKEKT